MFTINYRSTAGRRRFCVWFYLNDTGLVFACRYFNNKRAAFHLWRSLPATRRGAVYLRDAFVVGGWRCLVYRDISQSK